MGVVEVDSHHPALFIEGVKIIYRGGQMNQSSNVEKYLKLVEELGKKPTPKIVEDLGLIYAKSDSKFKRRRYLLGCPCCCEHYDVDASSYNSGKAAKVCPKCYVDVGNDRNHGFSDTKLHNVWSSMKTRCLCKTDKSYHNYGGRGITICDEWRGNFLKFRDWALDNGYKEGLSIDRIDNDGNYESSNCRWANGHVQGANQRRKTQETSSRYIGVSFNKRMERYEVNIKVHDKPIHLGMYDSELDAGRAYDMYCYANGLMEYTNNGLLSEEEKESPKFEKPYKNRNNTTGYIGVVVGKTENTYIAQSTINGKPMYFGTFYSMTDAAKARDRYIIENGLKHKLNDVFSKEEAEQIKRGAL